MQSSWTSCCLAIRRKIDTATEAHHLRRLVSCFPRLLEDPVDRGRVLGRIEEVLSYTEDEHTITYMNFLLQDINDRSIRDWRDPNVYYRFH